MVKSSEDLQFVEDGLLAILDGLDLLLFHNLDSIPLLVGFLNATVNLSVIALVQVLPQIVLVVEFRLQDAL